MRNRVYPVPLLPSSIGFDRHPTSSAFLYVLFEPRLMTSFNLIRRPRPSDLSYHPRFLTPYCRPRIIILITNPIAITIEIQIRNQIQIQKPNQNN
jgi:hypothetical protein